MKNELASPGQSKGRKTRFTPVKLGLLIAALFLLLSAVYAPAEKPLFLGTDAVIKDTRQGSRGGDGYYYQYLFFGYGTDAGWGGDGGSVNIIYKGPPITGHPGYAGIYGESSGGEGGRGGGGTSGFYAYGGRGGWGGLGGVVTIENYSRIFTTGGNAFGIYGSSIGGRGGDGGEGHGAYGRGGDGGLGREGNIVTIENMYDANIHTSGSRSHGIFAQSIGGYGGVGGAGGGVYGQGGMGRGAGSGGVVSVENRAWIVTSGDAAMGIYAQSIGGFAGSGGGGSGIWGYGSGSYSGGAGDRVTVNNLFGGEIQSSGWGAHGIFAQSVGGGGGHAGQGAGIVSLGGSGSAGGYGGTVSVDNDQKITVSGKQSYGIFAQSVGGGGGSADAAIGLYSIGGGGGGGGRADAVSVRNLRQIDATSHAIFAQSIGGGGGSGGNSVGWVSIGGSASLGGDGGRVNVDNFGLLETSENNAAAIFAQSVGGGGGKGGGAVSAGWWNSVAMGGSGGSGGSGNAVTVTSKETKYKIQTGGFNSDGIFAQSVGGGGGAGGYSVAGSTGELFSSSVALGGSGGSGGRGASVKVTTAMDISTEGNQSRGIFAQSVGGGGGSGGFSVAGALGGNFSTAVGLGGKGGGGGDGGSVEVVTEEKRAISTRGDSSQGIFAQSVGGGGGTAGFAITGTAGSIGASVSLGGSGGSGGSGANVRVASDNDIATNGTGSAAIFAQSVGGGGGAGGFSVAGTLSMAGGGAVSLGGKGGYGGSGGQVDVRTSGSIKTGGDQAKGVVAQSVGGGGGKGGFSVSGTISGLAAASVSLGGSGGVGGSGGAVTLDASGKKIDTSGNAAAALFAQSVGGGGGAGNFSASGAIATGAPDLPSFAAAVSLGGSGGTGGRGGTVSLQSSVESIATSNKNSSGIFAQSVGGGGGAGGFSGALAFSKNTSLGFSLGGSGGAGNAASDVSVVSSSSILAKEEQSYGIFAQSVGGGGGAGGFSVGGQISYGQTAFSLGATLGGFGGTGGTGGNVDLNLRGESVVTYGENASALFAQSVGGGGGAGGFSANITATPASNMPFSNLSASLGGKGAAGGVGGRVSMTNSVDLVKTYGKNSSGVFAQSVGGGGGKGGFSGNLAFGKKSALNFSMGGDGGSGNKGGEVDIFNSSGIYTSAQHSKGIFAQSVGGGGGSGGFSATGAISYTDFGGLSVGLSIGGNGGTGGDGGRVSVNSSGALINTKGDYSSGIAAQSVGGGGGDGSLNISVTASKNMNFSFADVPYLSLGSKGGGAGRGGDVFVQNQGRIATWGKSSSGIFAQSVGGGGGAGGTNVAVSGSASNLKEFSISVGASGVGGVGGGDAGNVTVRDPKAEGADVKIIATEGNFSPGIYGESTGGGGGKAGWSFDSGLSTEKDSLLPNWKINVGASGGAGGKGGNVEVATASDISTRGEQSSGVVASSTGGGGGQGGIVVAVAIKSEPTKTQLSSLSVTQGGSGGVGNKAGNVLVVATGSRIETTGNSSSGIAAKSTGGGGGDAGGAISVSIADTKAGSGASLSLSMGGTGGNGGEGGAVNVASESSISTGSAQDGMFFRGNDAHGITASSVGGGGGSGGFSISGMFNMGAGEKNGGVALSLGGSGGSGNKSGEVRVQSTGVFIQTLGDRSTGIAASSIGGGGGSGGFSIAGGASLSSQKINGELSFSMGGKGGSGGHAGNVSVINKSSIQTGRRDYDVIHGHLSPAISATSTGGGGGSGGFSIAGSVTTTAALTPSIGGSGGAGGDGGAIDIQNEGETLATTGYHAPGINATSIGGGGGKGGFSIAGSLAVANLGVSIGGGGGSGGVGGSVNVASSSTKIATAGSDSPGILTQSIGGGGGQGGFSIDSFIGAGGIGISIGGSGGKGGVGGSISINDTGKEIVSSGKRSSGILAQSIGAGGGQGGIGIAAPLAAIPIPIMVGGRDAASGSGGKITIATNSNITTMARDSQGILAQSVGAGGGTAIINANADSISGTVKLGAKGLSSGDGGVVEIRANPADITTNGVNSSGIIAQSIGGGGGIGSVEVQSFDSNTSRVALGADNSSGNGGMVDVLNFSKISVNGTASHGIIAQSIGAGGGMASSAAFGRFGDSRPTLGGTNNASGAGGRVEITNFGNINIASAGGFGLIAQSVGGGGGMLNTSSPSVALFAEGKGDGGTVLVYNSKDSRITTSNSSVGIFAQSIGGGGGMANIYGQLLLGADSIDKGGNGSGGDVTVSNIGTVEAGSSSVGIFAQSLGGGGGFVYGSGYGSRKGSGNSGKVTVYQSGSVQITGNKSAGIVAISDSYNGTKGRITIDLAGNLTVAGNNSYGISVYGGPAEIYVKPGANLRVFSLTGSSYDWSSPFKLGSSQTTITNQGSINTNSPLFSDVSGGLYFRNYGNVSALSLTLPALSHFEQHSGIVDLSKGNLDIGGYKDFAGEPATYSMLGGTLRAQDILIGAFPNTHGKFIQNGGQVSADRLVLGTDYPRDNSGEYFKYKGKLDAKNIIIKRTGKLVIGDKSAEKGAAAGDSVSIIADSIFLDGGYLAGTGILAAHVLSGGFLNPGSSPGTLIIDGSYTKLTGGTLIAEIASETEYDRLKVMGAPGTVDLSPQGDILRPVLLPGSYRPKSGQVFASIIEATGGISGIFNRIQGSPTMLWDVAYHPNSIDLVLKGRNYASPSINLSPNLSMLGSLFNAVSDTAAGDLGMVLNIIDHLENPSDIRDAYRQITSEKAAALSAFSINNGLFQARAQASRLINKSLAADASYGSSAIGAYPRIMLAQASDDLSGMFPEKSSAEKKRGGVYLYPLISWGDEKTAENRAGYRFTTTGFTTGIDYHVGDNVVFGVSSGYTFADASFDSSGGRLKTQTIPLSVYGLYLGSSWYASGSLGYALNLYDLERKIVFGGIDRTAVSDTKSHQINVHGEAGYNLEIGKVNVAPMLSVSYSGLWIDGYRERGAGALDLDVAAQQVQSLQSGFGARVSTTFRRDRYSIIPQLYATYQHEFANGARNISASLKQAGTFAFKTDDPQRDFFVAGAKLSIAKGNNLNFELNYNTDLGRSSSTSHSIYAGVRWQF